MKYIDADKKSVKEMMDSLNEKIAKATKSWAGVDVDEFMDEMRGREPDKDLEEAAKHHSEQYRPHWPNQVRPAYDSFIAGAKWQKEQFEKNRLAHCDKLTKEEYDRETDFALGIVENERRQPTFTDAINYGMRVMKEQMMKEAVEGYVNYYEDSGGILIAEAQVGSPYHSGDKVRIIVLPKED